MLRSNINRKDRTKRTERIIQFTLIQFKVIFCQNFTIIITQIIYIPMVVELNIF